LKKIMVVDDERAVAEIMEQTLEKSGYDHVSFDDPLQALRYFEEHSQEVHAAITNMTMPQMSGPQLAENLRRIRADICLILITGHGNDQMDQIPPDKLELYNKILYKPFAREELLDAIEAACAA
jgi:DNA-binding NtrC family response regulator